MKKSTCLAGALALGLILPAAGLGTSLVAASGANAQQNAGSGQTGGSVAFVLESGNAGRFEVQSGRLALERSQHVGVRGYAGQTNSQFARYSVCDAKGPRIVNVEGLLPGTPQK